MALAKYLAILALVLVLVPVLSQAKIGETKAEVEARLGKPSKLETFWPTVGIEAHTLLGDFTFYESPADWRDGFVGVSYRLGKVAAEFYPCQKDENVMRALEAAIGTSDLDENPWPRAAFNGCPAYVTKDKKYYAYVVPTYGTFVMTEGPSLSAQRTISSLLG